MTSLSEIAPELLKRKWDSYGWNVFVSFGGAKGNSDLEQTLWGSFMGLISKRSRCYLIQGLMDQSAIISQAIHRATPPKHEVREVSSHAMIRLEKPTAAFNVHQTGFEVPPVHACQLPPESPGTSQPRPTKFIAAEKSSTWLKKPCLTWCRRHGFRSDKGGYKKTHPFGLEVILIAMDTAVISSWLVGERCWPAVCSFVYGGSFVLADMYSKAWLHVSMAIFFLYPGHGT